MGNLLETIYDLLVGPKTAFEEIVQTKTIGQAFWIVLFSNALIILAFFSGSMELGFKIFLLLLQVVSGVLIWGVSTAVWHLLAELLGARGSVRELLVAVGFVSFIQILMIPVYLIANVMLEGSEALLAIAGIVLMIWSSVLEIFAIQSVYRVSGAKAVLIFLLPVLIAIGLVVVTVVLAGSMIMTAASQIMVNPPQF